MILALARIVIYSFIVLATVITIVLSLRSKIMIVKLLQCRPQDKRSSLFLEIGREEEKKFFSRLRTTSMLPSTRSRGGTLAVTTRPPDDFRTKCPEMFRTICPTMFRIICPKIFRTIYPTIYLTKCPQMFRPICPKMLQTIRPTIFRPICPKIFRTL